MLREINGSWVEITTPYLDRHNDALQIYASLNNALRLFPGFWNDKVKQVVVTTCAIKFDFWRVPHVMTIQPINRPNRDNAETLIHKWTDTRDVRSTESRAYALLNDMGQSVPNGVVEALASYSIRSVRWSSREEYLSELAA